MRVDVRLCSDGMYVCIAHRDMYVCESLHVCACAISS